MKVTMNTKAMKTTEAMKAAVLDNLDKLNHYKNLIRAEVVMKAEKNNYITEILLHGKKVHLYTKAKADDMYKAIRKAVTKMEHQLEHKLHY